MAADVKKIAEWIDGKREILSSGRKNYENLCRQVTELFCPNRDDFGTQRSAGENRVRRLYNPIGIQCVEMASADLYGLLTDPSSYWFEYSFQNVNEMSDQMIVWLRRQSEIVFNLMYTPALPKHTPTIWCTGRTSFIFRGTTSGIALCTKICDCPNVISMKMKAVCPTPLSAVMK